MTQTNGATMPTYEVYNPGSGHSIGYFEAVDADDALEVLARDAGYANYADMCAVSGLATLCAAEVSACAECQTRGEVRECCVCGYTVAVIDCGHQPQPPVISAGRDDGKDPDHWYCEDCGSSVARGEAVSEIADADTRDSLWEAAVHACVLHDVPLLASDSYLVIAQAARERGHYDLADTLADAWVRQRHWDHGDPEPETDEPLLPGRAPARACYGCGRELDRHAGLSVVYCGRCGDR